jgi:hypothetical protein
MPGATASNADVPGVAARTQAASRAETILAALVAGCTCQPSGNTAFYRCNGQWVEPAFDANGVDDRTRAAP